MEGALQIFILVQIVPHGDGFTILGAYKDYEAAQVEARRYGVDQCRVLATSLS
jgi:hypothetical protein